VIDNAGVIYVADTLNCSIRKIAPDAVVTTFAGTPPRRDAFVGIPGSSDGTGTSAQFNFPYGVTIDPSGNLYVADTINDTIRKITLLASPMAPGKQQGSIIH
jgi:DNA-binding beta-propeller fold protein YncE